MKLDKKNGLRDCPGQSLFLREDTGKDIVIAE
jgi:hypothetical protein